MGYDGHVILHDIEKTDLPKIASVAGKNVEIRCVGGRIGAIESELERRERYRGWSR
jgi:hypothetical protein